MFRNFLRFMIVFSFAMAIFDFVNAVRYADRGVGWVLYFAVFGLIMIALGVVNINTLVGDIKSEREHKAWMRSFEERWGIKQDAS